MTKPGPDIRGVMQWPDPHHPFHDKRAHETLYQFARKNRKYISHHMHPGDCLDLGGPSHHNIKNYITQNEHKVIDGFRSLGAHFNTLFKVTPDARVWWILGNHEDRLNRFVEEHPSWSGICDDLLGMLEVYGKCPRAREIKLVELKYSEDDCAVGKMHFAHGWSASKHVASQMLVEYAGENVTFGHAHTMQMHSATVRGEPHAGYCIGHLASREASLYAKGRANRWVTGFAYMEYDPKSGIFSQHLLPIVDGKFFFGGRLYGE